MQPRFPPYAHTEHITCSIQGCVLLLGGQPGIQHSQRGMAVVIKPPCPWKYTCPLLHPLRQPALPFQVALSCTVWHRSCRCFVRTNSGLHAGGRMEDLMQLTQPPSCSPSRILVILVALWLVPTHDKPSHGKNEKLGSAAIDYACRCAYLNPVSDSPPQKC